MSILTVIVIFIVLLCLVPGMAKKRGRSGFGWFVLSLLFSPLLSIILLALLGDTDEKRRQKVIEEEKLRQRVAQKYVATPPPPLKDESESHERYWPKND